MLQDNWHGGLCGRKNFCNKINKGNLENWKEKQDLGCMQCLAQQGKEYPDHVLRKLTNVYLEIATMGEMDNLLISEWRKKGILDLDDIRIMSALKIRNMFK